MSAPESSSGSDPRARPFTARLLIVLMALESNTWAAEAVLPADVIAATATAIAEVMKERQDELDSDRRKLNALVKELLLPRFDLETSCRLILGSHWKTATPEQRKRFVEAFYGFLVASYGHALLEFNHDTLKVLPSQEPVVGSSTQVRTRMKLTSGRIYQVDFYMRLGDTGWRVVDILVEGVSYVRSYRGDFGLEIRASGLDALSGRLEAFAARKQSPVR